MSSRMRDLIKTVRACKTAAEEREVIARESAKIRTSFKENENEYRQRNVAKLLYIHMLGYPAHFGAMECLKLIVSPHYSSKRLGYLGLMLLMDENQEVLMLVTNTLKGDLFHPNQFVAGLALCALADLASPEMARDTAPEIEKLLQSTNSYIRKKAALCALRIVRKEPELAENFVPRVRILLSERNHGVLITGISLMIELLKIDPSITPEFRKVVPNLVRILKSLVMSGHAPEYDVGGVTDPFLQVLLLRVLRILGRGDKEASEHMNDVLAQVATNTESVRNVGNAILYECVQTIMTIESEQGLKVLAINVLGRFLLNRDNNIRYVALNTLSTVVSADFQAVQRHRDTIVECLKDADVSIRRRALDLIYGLVNENNVKSLVRELLNFLLFSDVEFRSDLVGKLTMLINKYAPTPKWQFDTTLRVMTIAGNHYLPEDVPAAVISLVTRTPDLQAYAGEKLFSALRGEVAPSQPLSQVSVWVLGEYANIIVGKTPNGADAAITDTDLVDAIEDTLRDSLSNGLTRDYCVNALAKLSTRISSQDNRVKALLEEYKTSVDVELQQRALEYSNLFNFAEHRSTVLQPVPPLDRTISEAPSLDKLPANETQSPATGGASGGGGGGLLDLDDLFGPSGGSAPPPATTAPVSSNPLDDLFGPAPTSSSTAPAPTSSGLDDLLGLGMPSSNQPAAAPANPNELTAYDKNGLHILFDIKKNPAQPHLTLVNATVTNRGDALQNLVFQAAVPKYLKVLLEPPSSTNIMPNQTSTITIKLSNSMHGQKPILLKIKVGGQRASGNFDDVADVAFPPQF